MMWCLLVGSAVQSFANVRMSRPPRSGVAFGTCVIGSRVIEPAPQARASHRRAPRVARPGMRAPARVVQCGPDRSDAHRADAAHTPTKEYRPAPGDGPRTSPCRARGASDSAEPGTHASWHV